MQLSQLFRIAVMAVTLGIGLAAPRMLFALAFEPTESEWATWPEYCKARYMESAAGRSSDTFAGRMPEAQVRAWKAKMGQGWVGLHHHCAALVHVDRARWEKDPRERTRLLRRSLEENQFMLDRMPKEHPMRAQVAAHNGTALSELRDLEAADRWFAEAIEGCPTCPVGYHTKARYLMKQKRLNEAREVLETGVQATNGESAELHYFLGLLLVDLKDFESAQTHALRAYELGYPLPGLRKRLADAGYKID